MTRGEVIESLRKRNIPVSRRQIEEAINEGRVERPRKNGAGHYCYTDAHVDKLAELFNQQVQPKAT